MGQKITIAATAERLGISKDSVKRLISTGELRAYRIGSQYSVRVDTDDADAILTPVVPKARRA
jgi:excisionase family DNA binding protein